MATQASSLRLQQEEVHGSHACMGNHFEKHDSLSMYRTMHEFPCMRASLTYVCTGASGSHVVYCLSIVGFHGITYPCLTIF